MFSKRQIIYLGECVCCLNRRAVKPSKKFTSVQAVTTPGRALSSSQTVIDNDKPKDFTLNRAVVMRKITRYEYEKQWNPDFSETELKKYVRKIGVCSGVRVVSYNVMICDQ